MIDETGLAVSIDIFDVNKKKKKLLIMIKFSILNYINDVVVSI